MAKRFKKSAKYDGVEQYLPNGTWRARWYGADGKPDQKSGFPTEEAARLYRAERLVAIGKGQRTRERDRKQTVGSMATRWLANLKVTAKSQGTYRAYSQRWRTMLAPTFEHMALANVTRATVRDWQAAMTTEGYNNRTIAAAQTVLNMVMTYAVDDGAIEVNAIAGLKRVEVPKLKDDYKEALSESTIRAILEAADPRYLIAFEMALYAGLRSGEFRGLSVDDVSLTADGKCRLRIHQQLGESGDYLHSTKTHSDVSIDVDGYLYERIMAHVDQYGTAGKARLVLSQAYENRPMIEQRWTEIWAETVKRAGVTLPAGTGIHSFRIACGSYIYADTGDLTIVQRILRHDNLNTTAAHYVKRTTDGAAATRGLVGRFATASTVRARGHLRAV